MLLLVGIIYKVCFFHWLFAMRRNLVRTESGPTCGLVKTDGSFHRCFFLMSNDDLCFLHTLSLSLRPNPNCRHSASQSLAKTITARRILSPTIAFLIYQRQIQDE
jgi:hypothetical protein